MRARALAPGLLLAMPQLDDPNFARAVVLMVQHGEDGSFGLVVNRPSEQPLLDVLAPLGIRWRGDPEEVVWLGGPVSLDSGWLLHAYDPDTAGEGTVKVSESIALSASLPLFREIGEKPPRRVRFLLGYAGWGSKQLESELAQGAWLTADATPELVFESPPDEMWERALRSIGVDPGSLVPGFGVH